MGRFGTRRLLVLLVVLALLALALFIFARPAAGQAPARVLLVTATTGFRHDSIPTARDVVQRLGLASGEFSVTLVSDVVGLTLIRPATLAAYSVVFFANTSGELPLDDAQKQALLDFVASGGGFVGTHSASDTFYTWPEYGQLLGAYFREHPWTQRVDVRVEDPTHPLTSGLGAAFSLDDEIYAFRSNPRGQARVLLSLDAGSVGTSGDYPLAWCKPYGAGRVFYNALGHHESTWLDPRFQQHLLDALRWAAGRAPADCAPG